MIAPQGFNIITQTFNADVNLGHPKIGAEEAMELNTAGVTISTVSGSAIGGTRTSATRFTRTAGVWIDFYIIPLTAATGTFTVGETVTESGSSSTGVVVEATTTRVVLKTISAVFTGSATLTGSTSAYTATGGTVVTCLTNLKGQWAFSHASGTLTAGNWVRITNSTAAYIDIDGALHATGTAVVIHPNEHEARRAMSITIAP